MIQIINKNGATNSDDGNVIILDKNGNVRKITTATPVIWGSITGNITLQTDLVSYLSTNYYPLSSNPANYATQSFVTSQGYITNVITALGYTPENVANKATDLTSPDNTKYPTTLVVSTALSGKQDSLGFTPENVANKSTNTSLGTSNTLYPTQNAVKVYADSKVTDAIVDGVTTVAPSQNAVFDALALKQNTLTNPITGTGANGQVAFFNGTTTQTGDNGLFWDNTNKRLGIGTNAPTNRLSLGATPAASLQQAPATFFSTNEGTSNNFVLVSADSASVLSRAIFQGIRSRGTLSSPTAVLAGDAITTFLSTAFDGTAGQASAGLSFDAESNASSGNAPQLINFITGSTFANRSTKMQVRSNGNVIIQNGGTFTDAGFRLDVNGTTRLNGNTSIGGGTAGARLDVRAQGALSTDIAFRVRNSADTSNIIQVQGNGNTIFGANIGGNTATHPITLGSLDSVNGIALFRTDSQTNFLRARHFFNGGIYNIALETGGTYASGGNMVLSAFGNSITLSGATNPRNGKILFNSTITAASGTVSSGYGFLGTIGNGDRVGASVLIATTVNQTAGNAGGFRQLWISPFQQSLSPIGVKLLIDAGVNSEVDVTGTHTSMFVVNNEGQTYINSQTVNTSAQLQVDSTTRGFLPPRMTTTQRNAIATPAAGLIVYDTTDNKHYGYNGTTWNAFY